MNSIFRCFVYLVSLDILLMPLGSVLGASGQGDIFYHLFKIPLVLIFLLCLIFSLYKFRLFSISYLFLGLIFSGALVGILNNGLSFKTVSHLYSYTLPVLGVSFGYYIAKYANQKTIRLANSAIKFTTFVLSLILSIYFLLYQLGVIIYFGMASKIYYSFAYYLSLNKIPAILYLVGMSFFGGKRTILIAFTVQCFLKGMSLDRLRNSIFVLITFIFVIILSVYIGLADRVLNVLTYDLTTYEGLYYATSGRSAEVFTIFNILRDDIGSLLFGRGFGSTYSFQTLGSQSYTYTTHFVHFTPLYYAFVSGVIACFLIYIYIFNLYYRTRHFSQNVFYLLSFSMFSISFLGAIPAIDIQFWILIGILEQLYRRPIKVNIDNKQLNQQILLARS